MKFETNELRWHGKEHLESKVMELNQPTHSAEIFVFLSSYTVK